MKLSYRITVEMTPAQVKLYCEEYGIDRAALRENIRSYIENGMQCSAGLDVEDGRTEGVTVR